MAQNPFTGASLGLIQDAVNRRLPSVGADSGLAKAEPAKRKIRVEFADPAVADMVVDQVSPEENAQGVTPLVKSIMNVLNGPGGKSIERLAFESDPSNINQFSAVYKAKLRLLPDKVLKRIAIQDDLVASIVNARSNHLAAFGRPRPDRFSTGLVIEPHKGVTEKMTPEEKKDLDYRIEVATTKLYNCGDTGGWDDEDKLTFAQYLFMSTRNAIVVGRIATEIIWAQDALGNKKFHSFRPIDAGTIYRAAPQKDAVEEVRREARHLLETLKNKRLEPERVMNDEYAWIQVHDARPLQAFTSEECLVHNFYPVADVELDGYPVTPLDTVLAAVTTHINITTHNKLYFQTGRATRGMLVFQSDDVNEEVIQGIRQQFNASINSVSNAWRMPVFGVGVDEQVTWQPIDSGARDMEFQYLSDTNARVILSAFQMSPEELPGYAHLSRGTNSQALSESNTEFKLEAHRDVGIRPLIAAWQDIINSRLLPLIDPELAKICSVKLLGLEAETAEKESIRLQQDMPVHMTYNEVLDVVEKEPVDISVGGDFPLNPQYQAILDKYVPVGHILETYFGVKDASKDPRWDYCRDPFYFEQTQMLMQQQAMQQQQQAMQQQQQAQGGAPPPEGGGGQPPPPDEGGGQPGEAPPPDQDQQQELQLGEQDLTRILDQAIGSLGKSEAQLPPSRRRLLAQHKATVDRFMKDWEQDSAKFLRDVLDVAEKHAPKQSTADKIKDE